MQMLLNKLMENVLRQSDLVTNEKLMLGVAIILCNIGAATIN